MTNQTWIFKILSRKHGLRLTSESANYLSELFKELDQNQLQENLDFIAQEWVHLNGAGKKPIEKPGLEDLISTVMKSSTSEDQQRKIADSYFVVLDTFATPQYTYDYQDKTFVKDLQTHSVISDYHAKTKRYRDRYDLLKQRLLRQPAFRKPSYAADEDSYYHITPVTHLKGKSVGRYLLFGMLTQIEDGKLHLEDTDGYMELSFQENITKSDGIFTQNCFCLVEGLYDQTNIFQVETIGMPPPESRQDSMYIILISACLSDTINLFGGPRYTESDEDLKHKELLADEMMLVIMSDVHLDHPKIFEKLQVLFQGYSEAVVPFAFILIGNFQSTPFVANAEHVASYREQFEQLATLISKFPLIAQSHFVIVPGPNDPWATGTLPRPPLPASITRKLSQKVKNCHFAGNPCRLQFYTQQFVIFREDLVNSLTRNAVLATDCTEDTPVDRHVASTVLDQACLSPLPIEQRPVLWGYDSTMRVYPAPDVLILADKYGSYAHDVDGCCVFNPGPFTNSEFQFTVYQLSERVVEVSKL